jgi:hypothetical protein
VRNASNGEEALSAQERHLPAGRYFSRSWIPPRSGIRKAELCSSKVPHFGSRLMTGIPEDGKSNQTPPRLDKAGRHGRRRDCRVLYERKSTHPFIPSRQRASRHTEGTFQALTKEPRKNRILSFTSPLVCWHAGRERGAEGCVPLTSGRKEVSVTISASSFPARKIRKAGSRTAGLSVHFSRLRNMDGGIPYNGTFWRSRKKVDTTH